MTKEHQPRLAFRQGNGKRGKEQHIVCSCGEQTRWRQISDKAQLALDWKNHLAKKEAASA